MDKDARHRVYGGWGSGIRVSGVESECRGCLLLEHVVVQGLGFGGGSFWITVEAMERARVHVEGYKS